jgi:hypothetical protein
MLVRVVSGKEAEHLIARVWILIEKHQITSPKVVTKPQSDRLQVELHFSSEIDEDLIATELGLPATAQ